VTDDLTHDAFLGGRLTLWQPRRGYRAGVDPVLLAASVPARPGQRVLELGCGVGAAMLCLQTRVTGLDLTGVELQPAYADLARRNAAPLGEPYRIHTLSIRFLAPEIRACRYDHVIMNPPYFDRDAGSKSSDPGRDLAMGGDTPLAEWLDIGIKRLAPKGTISVIQHITRLPEVLAASAGRVGSILVKPIQPRAGKPPNLFIFRARQGGRAPFVMAPPLVMHDGPAHQGDRESYTPHVSKILRQGAALPLED